MQYLECDTCFEHSAGSIYDAQTPAEDLAGPRWFEMSDGRHLCRECYSFEMAGGGSK